MSIDGVVRVVVRSAAIRLRSLAEFVLRRVDASGEGHEQSAASDPREDESAGGAADLPGEPPAHWVERVRHTAPHLLRPGPTVRVPVPPGHRPYPGTSEAERDGGPPDQPSEPMPRHARPEAPSYPQAQPRPRSAAAAPIYPRVGGRTGDVAPSYPAPHARHLSPRAGQVVESHFPSSIPLLPRPHEPAPEGASVIESSNRSPSAVERIPLSSQGMEGGRSRSGDGGGPSSDMASSSDHGEPAASWAATREQRGNADFASNIDWHEQTLPTTSPPPQRSGVPGAPFADRETTPTPRSRWPAISLEDTASEPLFAGRPASADERVGLPERPYAPRYVEDHAPRRAFQGGQPLVSSASGADKSAVVAPLAVEADHDRAVAPTPGDFTWSGSDVDDPWPALPDRPSAASPDEAAVKLLAERHHLANIFLEQEGTPWSA